MRPWEVVTSSYAGETRYRVCRPVSPECTGVIVVALETGDPGLAERTALELNSPLEYDYGEPT
jgi:hypothetical protein